MAIAGDLADAAIHHNVDLLRYSEGLRQDVLGQLGLLEEDLVAQIHAADITGAKRTAYQIGRQQALLKQTRETIQSSYRDINKRVGSELRGLAELESNWAGKMINDGFQSKIVDMGLPRSNLRQIVRGSMIEGAPHTEWWGRQSANTRQRFDNQIRMGVMQGETNDQLVKRIRGSATGKRRVVTAGGKKRVLREYSGGVMDVSKREATTLVRTSTQTIANNTNMAVYANNSEVIKGVQALVTLDLRTSDICKARSGKAWRLDDGMVKKYKDPPPEAPKPKPKKVEPKETKPYKEAYADWVKGLSKEEKEVISWYGTDAGALQCRKFAKGEKVPKYAEERYNQLNALLDKGPKREEVIFRGMDKLKPADMKLFTTVGNELEFIGPTSWSQKREVAQDFASYGRDLYSERSAKRSIIFRMKSNRGLKLPQKFLKDKEWEVLQKAGRFQVAEVMKHPVTNAVADKVKWGLLNNTSVPRSVLVSKKKVGVEFKPMTAARLRELVEKYPPKKGLSPDKLRAYKRNVLGSIGKVKDAGFFHEVVLENM